MSQQTTQLNSEQQGQYGERGYHFPIPVFEGGEAAGYSKRFLQYYEQNQETLRTMLPRDRRFHMMDTHFFLRWVYDIVKHPRVLDAVQSVLGPDIMVWGSQWFPKFPHDKTFVSWHQDATYWGLTPPNVTTAWVALTESTPENGCMRVVGGTHNAPLLPQRETYAIDNLLSRGQEIAVEVDEAQAVDIVLRPGEFSLHHVGIVHGSRANNSNIARIGLAIRYISPDVVQSGSARDLVLLVRGKDEYGHFDIVDAPTRDFAFAESPIHQEALRRKNANLMPKDFVAKF